MPARIIRERACASKTLAALSSDAERLWWRLLTHCDDFGLFDAEPSVVAGNCVPLLHWTEARTAALLAEMGAAGLVVLYQHKDHSYGRVLTFREYNRTRAQEPKFPLPLDGACQQMLADDNICQQTTTNVGLRARGRGRASVSDSECISSEPSRDPSTTKHESEAYAVADALSAVVFDHNPQHPQRASYPVAARAKWAADLLQLHHDGVTWESIRAAIAWLPSDTFWLGAITDGAGLVKNFAKLEAKRLAEQKASAATKPEAQRSPRLKTPDEAAAADPAEAERLAEFRARYGGQS